MKPPWFVSDNRIGDGGAAAALAVALGGGVVQDQCAAAFRATTAASVTAATVRPTSRAAACVQGLSRYVKENIFMFTTTVVREANMGHQLADDNSSWCPKVKPRDTAHVEFFCDTEHSISSVSTGPFICAEPRAGEDSY